MHCVNATANAIESWSPWIIVILFRVYQRTLHILYFMLNLQAYEVYRLGSRHGGDIMQHTPKDNDKKTGQRMDDEVVINQKNVNSEFQRIAKKNLERYRPAMEELAK